MKNKFIAKYLLFFPPKTIKLFYREPYFRPAAALIKKNNVSLVVEKKALTLIVSNVHICWRAVK